MNRGFKYYFRKGIKASGKTMVKNKNYIKYFLYGIAEIIGRMLILPGLIFDLANVRLAKLVRDEQNITISDTFKSGSKAKSLWTLVLVYLMMGILFVTGATFIVILTAICALIGAAFGVAFGEDVIAIMAILFAVPGVIVLIVYSIIAPFYMTPATYIIDSDENATMATVLKKCFKAMRKTGKRTTFHNYLMPALIKVAYIIVYGVITGIFFALTMLLKEMEVISKVCYLVTLIVFLIAVAGYIFGAPILSLTTKVANYSLCEDLVENPEGNKKVNGLYVKKFEKRYVPVKSLESSLTLLFDETEDENIILKENLKQAKSEPNVEDTNNTDLENNNDVEEASDVENNVEATTEEAPVEETQSVTEKVQEEPVEEIQTEEAEPVAEEVQVEETQPATEEVQEEPVAEEVKVEEESAIEEKAEEI